MPGDAPDDQDARDQEFVRWLRALADTVERDPALAERVREHAAPPPDPVPSRAGEGEIAGSDDGLGAQFIAPAPVPDDAPNPALVEPVSDALAPGDRLPGNLVPDDHLTLGSDIDGEPVGGQGEHKASPLQTEIVKIDTPMPSTSIAPTLRHTRRSSRYGPPSVSGRAAELGTGVPDPFAVFAASGEDGLRRALETLRVGSLRAIIRAHELDPQGKLGAGATEKRLITTIVAAAKRTAGTGGQPATRRKTAKRAKPTKPTNT